MPMIPFPENQRILYLQGLQMAFGIWSQVNGYEKMSKCACFLGSCLTKYYPESMIVYGPCTVCDIYLYCGRVGRLGTPSIVTRSSLCQIGHKLPRLSPPSEEVSTLRLVISH